MKIRTKLIFNYSILSIILLLLFSAICVFSYIKYRQHDFNVRLHNRAVSTANLLLNVSNLDSSMLHKIDRNIITAMGDLQITIYSEKHKMVYTDSKLFQENNSVDNKNGQSFISDLFGFGYKTISFTYFKYGKQYQLEASAFDKVGLSELRSLLQIITWVLLISLFFIAGFGFYNAVWSLKPFQKIINEVELIKPDLLNKRVTVLGNDEISQLAISFNTLLERIEQAFETEKSFISNASHELRTPVTSIMGQIEVVLNKSRKEEEYISILKSVYEDSSQMANIINGFLELAEVNLANDQIHMEPLRIDELIFAVMDDFEKKKPHYNISLEYNSNPENFTQLVFMANAKLLRLMFSNLIDNAVNIQGIKKQK